MLQLSVCYSQFEVSSHERNKSICHASLLSRVKFTFYLLCVSASIEVSSPQRIKYGTLNGGGTLHLGM